MVKKKYVEEAGQIMAIPDEKAPEIIEVSYSKAKQLAKRPMSAKQQENIQRLVEMNKVKWEAQKKIKDEQFKKMQAEQEQKSTKILVKPKRIYPPRSGNSKEFSGGCSHSSGVQPRTKQAPKQNPKYQNDEEETSDEEVLQLENSEEEEEEVYQNKPKPKQPPTKPNKPSTPAPRPDIIAMRQKLEQLENQLKPSNTYSGLAVKFWKG